MEIVARHTKAHAWCSIKMQDFSGAPVVRNLPSSAVDMGSIPGQGTKIPHQGTKILHAVLNLIPGTATRERPLHCDEDSV